MVAWALRARRLRREPDLRLALRARRTALRAKGCAPVCRGAQPLAAIAALRYALGADGVARRLGLRLVVAPNRRTSTLAGRGAGGGAALLGCCA